MSFLYIWKFLLSKENHLLKHSGITYSTIEIKRRILSFHFAFREHFFLCINSKFINSIFLGLHARYCARCMRYKKTKLVSNLMDLTNTMILDGKWPSSNFPRRDTNIHSFLFCALLLTGVWCTISSALYCLCKPPSPIYSLLPHTKYYTKGKIKLSFNK